LHILAFDLTFTYPERKIISITANESTQKEVVKPSNEIELIDPYQQSILDQDVYSYLGSGPRGQLQPRFRYRVTFKETTSVRRRLSYAVYSIWMGKIRELSILKIGKELVPDFSTGKWGMVTNDSNVNIYGEADCLDIIEGRTWVSKVYGKKNSTVDMHFDWIKISPDGTMERIASSNMSTTWVAIKDHGIVEVEPYPDYLKGFLADVTPEDTANLEINEEYDHQLLKVDQSIIALDKSNPLYIAPSAPIIEPEIRIDTFNTTMDESNLVGNIYYAHYYQWQRKALDLFVYSIDRKYFLDDGVRGELFCLNSEVKHLREAMPFDQIQVRLSLREFYSSGIVLQCDYYNVNDPNNKAKLAYGTIDLIWIDGDKEAVKRIDFPEKMREKLSALTLELEGV